MRNTPSPGAFGSDRSAVRCDLFDRTRVRRCEGHLWELCECKPLLRGFQRASFSAEVNLQRDAVMGEGVGELGDDRIIDRHVGGTRKFPKTTPSPSTLLFEEKVIIAPDPETLFRERHDFSRRFFSRKRFRIARRTATTNWAFHAARFSRGADERTKL